MKASLQWMNEYVPVDMNRPAQELADELTQAGIPVEDVIAMDNGIKKITDDHKIAAAEVIASLVEKPAADEIIPSVFDDRLVPEIAKVIK